MANLQKQFEEFHGTIRLDFESNQKLANKRDIVLDKIKRHLEANNRPAFERLLQGSYKMRTGVFPLVDEEYDIDVGLIFDFEKEREAANTVRSWVYDAIKDHTDNVKARTPCIRVHYKDDYPYHLDLVVYGRLNGTLELGKKDAWVAADPERLLEYVKNAHAAFEGTEGNAGIDQLRRVVRYLKRWGDVRIPHESPEKPTGLAYTLLTIDNLSPTFAYDGEPDDAKALASVASAAALNTRIIAKKPTPEFEDMFGRLSAPQMEVLKADFATLAATLAAAMAEPEPYDACSLLVPLLGTDFPIPPKGSGGKKTSSPAIVPSSSSA